MNSNQSFSDTAILVLSCDKYSDLWIPFFQQFHSMWPECPYKIYLGSNTKKYNDKRISSLLSSSSVDWSSDLLAIISQIKESYVFLWLEDIFPTQKIDTKQFVESFQFLKKSQGNHIHIAPAIKPDRLSPDLKFGIYERGAPYRVTVPGFWKKSTLQSLLIPGENPWKFEIMGSYRSGYEDGYYTRMIPIFEFIRVVDKGKIRADAYKYCREHQIQLDLSRRKKFSYSDMIKGTIQEAIFSSVLAIPWKTRVSTMELLRRLLISY